MNIRSGLKSKKKLIFVKKLQFRCFGQILIFCIIKNQEKIGTLPIFLKFTLTGTEILCLYGHSLFNLPFFISFFGISGTTAETILEATHEAAINAVLPSPDPFS